MKISILTLFPEMFVGPFDHSIIKRAKEKNLLEINLVNIRNFGIGKHKVVDDKPYGGGIGMVLKVDVLDIALQATKDTQLNKEEEKSVLLDPRGKPFIQSTAKELAALKHLILICGHYEGFDERIRSLVDFELSLGDFVLTGGEIPSLAITDAVARLIPGVLKSDATQLESFSQSLLEHPHFTTPAIYKNLSVPEVLLSGNHANIDAWRKNQEQIITKKYRPDMIKK